MKKLLARFTLTLAAFAATTSFTLAAAGWDDDYDKALAQAKTEKKLVLLDFTGSDWCGWCIKLDKEVFSTPEFKSYAKDKLVLVEVDFPRGKQQAAKLKEQNAKLQKEFSIRGFPTIIVLDAEGKKVGQLGYMPGGPTAFLAELDKLKSK
ncbi:MAG: thioredoxin family protein [Chthoniobacter sp.]|nr:thioredoxin family protein [Chthoniobacter sp.]